MINMESSQTHNSTLLEGKEPKKKRDKDKKEEFRMHNIFLQQIVMNIGPNKHRIHSRNVVINQIEEVINTLVSEKGFSNAIVFQTGSFPLRTFLVEGDIDLTVIMGKEWSQSEDLLELLRYRLEEVKDKYNLHWVTYVENAEIKVLKLNMDGINVDVTFRQYGGILTYNFLENVDSSVSNSILKQCIILTKAFLHYECRLLGSKQGLLTTYALEIMVLYILNVYKSEIGNNLFKFFQKFVKVFSSFEFEEKIVTISGTLSKDEVAKCKRSNTTLDKISNKNTQNKNLLVTQSEVSKFKFKDDSKSNEFVIKNVNILDPITTNNNVGRSCTKLSTSRLKNALDRVKDIIKHFNKDVPNADVQKEQESHLKCLFKNTMRLITSLKTQEHILKKAHESNSDIDLSYEIGKLGSMGVRSDAVALNLRPRLCLASKNEKESLDLDLNTFQPYYTVYSYPLGELPPKKYSECEDQNSSIYSFCVEDEEFINQTKFEINYERRDDEYKKFIKQCLVNTDQNNLAKENASTNYKQQQMDYNNYYMNNQVNYYQNYYNQPTHYPNLRTNSYDEYKYYEGDKLEKRKSNIDYTQNLHKNSWTNYK